MSVGGGIGVGVGEVVVANCCVWMYAKSVAVLVVVLLSRLL